MAKKITDVEAELKQLEQFLDALFKFHDLIELRCIRTWEENGKKKTKLAERLWLKKGRLCSKSISKQLFKLNSGNNPANIFFGVCPRVEEGKGKTEDIRVVSSIWADIDHCKPEGALKRVRDANLPQPSMTINSGHGVHLYWLLTERVLVGGEVREKIQSILNAVQQAIGGDHTQDLARILRLPGFWNVKNARNGAKRVPCKIISIDPKKRYPLSEFAGLVMKPGLGGKPSSDSEGHGEGSIGRVLKRLEEVDVGERSEVDFWACCELLKAGLDKESAWRLVCDKSKFAERGREYFDLTWGKAADKLEDIARSDKVTNAIVKLVIDSNVLLFHDERREPHATVPCEGGRRNLHLGSKDFDLWLSHLIWDQQKQAYGSDILGAAKRALSAIARFDSPEHRLNVRCARADGVIWLDLDGVRAVRVTSQGWEIVSEPPILFRSFRSQQSLPDPIKGGDPRKVLRFVNLPDGNSRFLFLCYLVVALVPDIPMAALIIHGIQGTAKTTLLRIIKRLLDPSVVEVRGGVRNHEDFILSAFRNRVLFFDNITSVSEWLSDALCRTVTGGGLEKRTLYTDEDMTIFSLKRIVGMAGINLVANRPDLLDRSMILSLDPIPPEDRRDEESFWKEFEEARAGILGGLLDALSKAMGIMPKLHLKSLPRMADFARCGAAAAVALGQSEADFFTAYSENIIRQNEAAIAASPVAQAVIKLMEGRTSWKSVPSALLAELDSLAEDKLSINIKRKPWPQAPNALWFRLQEVLPNLLAEGITIERDRSSSRREIRLLKAAEDPSQPSQLSGETPIDDGNDDDDGFIAASQGPANMGEATLECGQRASEEDALRAAREMYPALLPEEEDLSDVRKEIAEFNNMSNDEQE